MPRREARNLSMCLTGIFTSLYSPENVTVVMTILAFAHQASIRNRIVFVGYSQYLNVTYIFFFVTLLKCNHVFKNLCSCTPLSVIYFLVNNELNRYFFSVILFYFSSLAIHL